MQVRTRWWWSWRSSGRPTSPCCWRAGFAVEHLDRPGWQDRTVGGSPADVLPNPSGRNARTPLAEIADHLRSAVRG